MIVDISRAGGSFHLAFDDLRARRRASPLAIAMDDLTKGHRRINQSLGGSSIAILSEREIRGDAKFRERPGVDVSGGRR
ncbi:hypothetical protein ABGB18_47445 [Nonomuraea sp. B12E4]|uniref:hypothetical protein n=1 Tax=Nonomuraea sp. B12E4 TaxID=3153564 RepID=UPI00325D44A9